MEGLNSMDNKSD